MSSNPLSLIDLSQLRCVSIAATDGDKLSIAKLRGWAEGIDVFRVARTLYIPEYGITVCNGFVPEEAINYSSHLDVRLGRIGNNESPPGAGLFLDLEDMDRSEREVCILGNIYSKNFGHWTEELLKVILMEEFGFDGCYVFPKWYPAFAQESLSLLGIKQHRIALVDRPVIFKSVLFTSTINHFRAHMFPAVICYLRDKLCEASGPAKKLAQRVWVERGTKANNGRSVINEEEVQTFIQRHGFSRLDFGQCSFKEQIAIDRGVDLLMGPHGSAFVHCGFMKSKRKIIEIFSPEHINPSVIQLCLALNHSYQQIVPVNAWPFPYKYGLDLMIDLDQLELAVLS